MSQPSDNLTARNGIELLATVRTLDPGGTARNQGFGNILELDRNSLVLESRWERRVGELLLVGVCFPGRRRRSSRPSTLKCVVAGIQDAAALHYALVIEEIDEESREELEEYLAKPAIVESA